MTMNRTVPVLTHAFVGWALCGATMSVGMAMTSLPRALLIHAFAAPIIFSAVSLSNFSRPSALSPLLGAIVFVGFVITVDFFVVALAINRSLEIFMSVLGTWLPFALIFASTYFTGLTRQRRDYRSNSDGAT